MSCRRQGTGRGAQGIRREPARAPFASRYANQPSAAEAAVIRAHARPSCFRAYCPITNGSSGAGVKHTISMNSAKHGDAASLARSMRTSSLSVGG